MAVANNLADFADSADMEINHHRLSLAFCLALAIHAALIFGLGFSHKQATKAQPTLAITLAQQRNQTTPQKADYLAQSHQQGSGTLQHKAILTAPQQTNFQAVTTQEVHQQPQPVKDVTTMQRRQEIASLEAKRHIQRQAYAKRPRVRRLTSMATAQSMMPYTCKTGAPKSRPLAISITPAKQNSSKYLANCECWCRCCLMAMFIR